MYKHPQKATQKYYLQLEAILYKYFGKLFFDSNRYIQT